MISDFYDLEFLSITRTLIFFIIIGCFIILEMFFTLHDIGKAGRRGRCVLNWKLGLLNMIIAFPISTVGAAYFCQIHHFGFFYYFNTPMWLVMIVWFFITDWIHYGYHRLGHASAFFWNFHRLHHSDISPNVTTTYRVHFLDYIFLNGIKVFIILLFGPYLLALLSIDLFVAICIFWEHTNVKLNDKFERYLSYFIVTPRYHIMHHRIDTDRTNFATTLTIWDKLTASRLEPIYETEQINQLVIGLKNDRKYDALLTLLFKPFEQPQFFQINYTFIGISMMMTAWVLSFFYF